MSDDKFSRFREQYKTFTYEDYHITKDDKYITVSFDFKIDGLCEFHPKTEIELTGLDILNDFSSPTARNIVFSLGMVELVSYWKIACPERVEIKCGFLNDRQKEFWKQLYFGGLSEFFYINGIETDKDSFMTIECDEAKDDIAPICYKTAGINLIPVGGGKDSAVTAELLKPLGKRNKFFTVNDQAARTETVIAAGYGEDDIIKTYRTIDKNLLELNKKGFLNGHTPFSAIVAFLSLYCAYLIGGEYIVLSNESSANSGNIEGREVNHQYSKSYRFENDFTEYVGENLLSGIRYFSLLRPFSELQIAKQFALLPQYHKVFRSCNRGSKKNIWCCKCAKCLFVYSILSPFLHLSTLSEVFGSEMLSDESLKDIFDGLVGFTPVKPFECVGTVSEINYALMLTAQRFIKENKKMPYLLDYFYKRADKSILDKNLLNEYNPVNNVPDDFLFAVKEMYENVSECGFDVQK